MNNKRILTIVLSLITSISIMASVNAQSFTDVDESNPYKAAIEFCQEKGYVLGVSETSFEPTGKLTRGQLATIWCRVLQLKDENHSFNDITKLKNYYDTPSIVLCSLGALKGTSDTTFSPDTFITREQLAVLTMRTYNLGVASEDAYKQYTDHASVSSWARDGLSACINANVFEGLYEEENFKPGEAVTRSEICKLIYNIQTPEYTVTIATLEGGAITASPAKGRPGTPITLTVTPDTGKMLKEGTLKYDDVDITGTSFIMPAKNVTISAIFEDIPTLESIAVTTQPTKTEYTVGEALDLGGLVITATYSDASITVVTEYTTSPSGGSVLDTEGVTTVSVSYTEGEVEKNTTFTVKVNGAPENPETPETP
jgi:hypothetical protein